MSPRSKRISLPPPVVAFAGWLIPGAGYWLLGQRIRALTVGITILILFILGLLIGGVRVVDPPASYFTFRIVFDKPWFIGQFLAGPITLICAKIGQNASMYASHARLNEIGTLYTAIAGMLNLLAIIDSSFRAARGEGED